MLPTAASSLLLCLWRAEVHNVSIELRTSGLLDLLVGQVQHSWISSDPAGGSF